MRAIVTREPGGSPGAEIIRHLVLSGMGKLLGPEAETRCCGARRPCADGYQPALSQGTWVLCDRFSDSTRAYQGRLGQVSPDILNAMQRVTIGDLKPDLTIILDIPVEVGLQRRRRVAAAACRIASRRKIFNSIRTCATPTGRSPPKIRSAASSSTPMPMPTRSHLTSGAPCAIICSSLRRGPVPHERTQVRTEIAVRHPRETADLFGHGEAETALLNAYRSGRIPHAWLIGGPQGIGKATLAYRMARSCSPIPIP